LNGQIPIPLNPFIIFEGDMALFRTRSTHCAKSFCAA
jgi:hypothetical protein